MLGVKDEPRQQLIHAFVTDGRTDSFLSKLVLCSPLVRDLRVFISRHKAQYAQMNLNQERGLTPSEAFWLASKLKDLAYG